MGCTVSRMERDEEVPVAVRRKFKEINRQHRHRKDSISAAELLHPEDIDTTDDEPFHVDQSSPSADHLQVPPSPATMVPRTTAEAVDVKDSEEEEVVAEKKDAAAAAAAILQDADDVASTATGPELAGSASDMVPPGSPSLRFYFVESLHDSDDDSFRGEQPKKESAKKPEEAKDGRDCSNQLSSSTSSKELEGVTKPAVHKKEKGKRFLTKAPSFVYALLNVRNCYSTTHSVPPGSVHGRTPLVPAAGNAT